jgi:CheY-like chemotaxis protein
VTIVRDPGLFDQKDSSMLHKIIMLVGDNPDDEVLTLRALRKNNIQNEVVVARDGVEALDYLFGTGADAERDTRRKPVVILLDLKLPKIDGLEVLRRLRADERTQCIPVVVLTSSKGEQDLINSYSFGCNSYIRKPVDFVQFVEAVRQLGLYWLVLNEMPPV